ncbi:MAG: glycosyltransferase family 4 protein [Myxococcales bacterium]
MSFSSDRPLKILVLSQHYWPEIAATAQLLSDLCADLVRAGHQVTVVCGKPSYRTTPGGAALRENHDGVEIQRVWTYAPQKRSIPRRLVHYGSYFGGSLLEAMRGERPDVCLVLSTPPLLLGVSGVLLDALRGVPFVYSVQDLYPDIAIHLGVIKEGSLATHAVERVASACYRAASELITLSSGMEERLAQKGLPRSKLHVIPNWADTSAITESPRDNAFAREHGLVGNFVVQYSGNLGLSQGLESVVDAAQLLAGHPVRFVFIGDGNAREGLQAQVRERKLENVVFMPPQPRERLSESLAACDIGLVPMKRGVGGDSVPSKLYGIMAAGRPVLASAEPTSEVARVLRAHGCGWLVAPESGEALAEGIVRALGTSPKERTRLGEAGRTACKVHYSRTAMTARYAEVLQRAARRAGAEQTETLPASRPHLATSRVS